MKNEECRMKNAEPAAFRHSSFFISLSEFDTFALLRSEAIVKRVLLLVVVLLACLPAVAQEQKPELPKKPPVMSPTARLAAAKTAYVKTAGGSKIPYNVITSGLEGWGRYTLVEDPAQADLVVEVSAPDEGSGVSISSSTTRNSVTGKPEESTKTTRNLSTDPIRMVVRDARNKVTLWTATEQPKGAMRQKAREDNLVEAAQRLVTKFRERVEPAQP
jgi:hypothetical protein